MTKYIMHYISWSNTSTSANIKAYDVNIKTIFILISSISATKKIIKSSKTDLLKTKPITTSIKIEIRPHEIETEQQQSRQNKKS